LKPKLKIGLALSGGGARAAAHIGLIKVLNDTGIQIDYISGTSGGAIVAALFAGGVPVEKMLDLADRGSLFRLFRPGIPSKGLTNLNYLKELLEEFLEVNKFEDLEIPLSLVASNLMSGKKEIFDSGSLYDGVMASCAVPLIFKPIKVNDQWYVDGGIFENLPVSPLQDKCDFIIGMNVMPIRALDEQAFDGMISIGLRTFEMAIAVNTQNSTPYCDLVIEPEAIAEYGVFNFSKSRELYEVGYEESMAQLKNLMNKLHTARLVLRDKE